MINLENISLMYERDSEQDTILKNLSMNVQKGERVSLIGASGSGKTSLLKMIGGMLAPTEGKLHVGGKNIYEIKEKERHDFMRSTMSFVYQDFKLLPQFTVLENVMLPLIPYKNKKKIKNQANEIIEKVGMIHRIGHYPWQLSGGEQQRVAFARALITKPSLLLCDEPTGNLDTINRDRLLHLMKEIHQGQQTIVLVTHDEVVARYGERTFLLEGGRVEEKVLNYD